jgi:hypothetical protein
VVLRGLLDFRAALRNAGFVTGFQWIDGSFVEDCEKVRGRPPGDVDVVSLLRRPEPHAAENDWQAFVAANAATIFNHDQIKADLHCDSFFIDLDIDPTAVAQQCAYWFGLFSHQRSSFRWKGMVQVNFICDDAEAEAELAARELQW